MSSAFTRLFRILRANVSKRASGPQVWSEPSDDQQGQPEAAGQESAAKDVDADLARYYANLEVPYGADLETVRDSWKRLVRKYHPDLHGADPQRQQVATELVKGLNQALEALEQRLDKVN